MSKHTPGPWHPYLDSFYVFDSDNHRVADTCANGKSDAECMANAHLIAAAPDLLAALEGLVKQFAHPTLESTLLADARAAIAKAHGGTP